TCPASEMLPSRTRSSRRSPAWSRRRAAFSPRRSSGSVCRSAPCTGHSASRGRSRTWRDWKSSPPPTSRRRCRSGFELRAEAPPRLLLDARAGKPFLGQDPGDLALVDRVRVGLFRVDHALADELGERVVQRHHPGAAARLGGGGNLVGYPPP